MDAVLPPTPTGHGGKRGVRGLTTCLLRSGSAATAEMMAIRRGPVGRHVVEALPGPDDEETARRRLKGPRPRRRGYRRARRLLWGTFVVGEPPAAGGVGARDSGFVRPPSSATNRRDVPPPPLSCISGHGQARERGCGRARMSDGADLVPHARVLLPCLPPWPLLT